MKFIIGDNVDSAHCTALKHEFLRCEDALKEFEQFATQMIMMAQVNHQRGRIPDVSESRFVAFRTYNAYARFIHHLYEFMVGALARDKTTTAHIEAVDAEQYITHHVNRILKNKRKAIIDGTAPSWENALGAYPERAPKEFAAEFRKHRNKLTGHVKYERSALSLTEFYDRYHKYMYMLYWDCLGHWGSHVDADFPDLKEITDFSVLIKEKTSASAGAKL